MYFVYFDSGTTNSRIYLINNYRVIDFLKENIGSKDSSISGDNSVLIKGLKELYDYLLDKNNIEDEDIKSIYASGLVTSPFGFKDIPHLSTPVSVRKLYEGIYSYYEPLFFARDINLIRGVKTIPQDFILDRNNFYLVNNMRGEEIEVFGILASFDDSLEEEGLAIILPGSHTHIAYIKKRVLTDILSTFSGELFHAVYSSTILANSIDYHIDKLDQEMVLLGFEKLKDYGINRALYLVNTLQVFSNFSKKEKTSFLEGVITGGVIQAFLNVLEEKWVDVSQVIIAGDNKITEAYEILLKNVESDLNIKTIAASEQESFAVKGFFELLKIGGI